MQKSLSILIFTLITFSLSSDGATVAIDAYLNDGNGTDSGHVRVYNLVNSVSAVNEPPVANAQNIKTKKDTPLEIKLTGSDPEDDPLTYLIKTLPTNGILKEGTNTILASELPKLLPADSLTYVPNANFVGDDSFDFIINANFLNSFSKANGLEFITQGGVPVTFQKPAGKTYYLIQETGSKMDWPDAKKLTDSFKGAQMFVPFNETMDKAIYDALKDMNRLGSSQNTKKPYWYGLSQDRNASDYSEPSGGWYWADGVKLGSAERPYTNWHSGEPNNGGNEEDHAQFNRFWGGFTWNDMAPGNTQSYALFEFSVSDSSDSNPATISIEVKSVNSPPIANNQSLKTNKETPLKIKLTGSDPEDDPLTYLIKTLPSNGILKEGNNTILASELPKLLPADSLSYVPNANFSGNDSFDFIVNANFLNSFTKANNLKFIENNGSPVTYQKPKGKTYFLIQNETGQAGFNPVDWPVAKTLTESISGAGMYVILDAAMSALVMNGLNDMGLGKGTSNLYWLGLYQDKTSPDYAEPGRENQNWGGWTWTDGVTLKDRGYHNWLPNEPNQAGDEDYGQMNWDQKGEPWNDMRLGAGQSWPLFEFSINENTNSNTATISIEVQNLIPLADSQTVTFSEGSINNAITLTGSDPQSNAITYILNTIPEKGILKVGGLALGDLPLTVGPGDLTYDPPNENYFGEQSFKFKVNNGEDDSAPATVTIIVKNVNDPPEGDPGDYSTKEDVPIDIIHVGRDKDLIDVFTVHTQMGTTLPQPSSVALGESMALSADGKRLILGAYNCPQCNNSFAQVYNWNGTDWDQLGATLDGDTTTDNFGEYVSISSDGNRIAVAGYSNDNANGADAGHVKVFDWDGTTWNSVGSPILGDKANDKFGYRGLHLSGDGNSMVIPSFRGGYLHTYNWNGIKWNKTGSITIVPNSTSEIPGQVYLSMDGNRLAVGSISDGTNGQVKIYDWNGTSWIQFTSIDGSAKLFGCTIDFSRDGKKLVVGEKASSLTRVYDLSGSSAVQIGSDIDFSGQQAAFFWRYVSISDDGNRVGIPVVTKKLGVFDWDGTSWNQLGEDVLATGLMGESFDMSSDGKIMAAGGHDGPNKVFNILNLEYIITTLPLNGTLKEGAKTLVAGDLPYTLTTSDQKLSYIPNNNYFGTDSYLFKLNDGKADSTNSLNGNREDSKVTITIEEFILTLPSNYKTTTIESCEGSDVGVLDIEVAATTFRKTGTTVDIPITYNVAIEGLGNVGTIVSPNKTLQVKDLAKGTYELKFTIVGEPKYVHPKIEFTIDEIPTPTVYDVGKIEVCDDAVDGDNLNGKAKFDTSTIINGMLKDPITGVVQDANLIDIEFTYFDQATNASVSAATLPNPFYSASQTVTVKLTSKANTSCIGVGAVVFVVNALPVFERIDDTKFVCLNLDAVTIGVKSSDSRTYSYTWTRNGTAFNLNIPGSDSTVLIGLGGDYEVTATTTDGTNCTQVLKFNIGESDIATVLKKDIIIADLNPGPNNTITVLTETLGIGDYEFAIDDVSGPYQDEPTFENVRPGLHTIYIRDKNECGVVNIKSLVIGYKKFFTPNGDGIHDTWNIIGLTKTSLPNSKIYIFDRFGKLLKELDPLGPGWDGTFIGKPMPSTDYWFRVVLEDGREFKSHFSLVRDWD